jgi:hypothetical protein
VAAFHERDRLSDPLQQLPSGRGVGAVGQGIEMRWGNGLGHYGESPLAVDVGILNSNSVLRSLQ